MNWFILAPLNDLCNFKIVPCENHRAEFGCKTFFNMLCTDPKVTMTEIATEEAHVYRFDISPVRSQLINFQVIIFLIS